MDGWCWVYLTSDPDSAIRLEAGDAVIIAGGESHIMGTERSKPEDPDLTKFYRPSDRPLPFVFSELGGQGDPLISCAATSDARRSRRSRPGAARVSQ